MIVLTEIPAGRVRVVGTQSSTPAGMDCVETLTDKGYRVVAILERVSSSPMMQQGSYDSAGGRYSESKVIGTSTVTMFDYVMSLDADASIAAAAAETKAAEGRAVLASAELANAKAEGTLQTQEIAKLKAQVHSLEHEVTYQKGQVDKHAEAVKAADTKAREAGKENAKVRLAVGAIRYTEILAEPAGK